MLQSIFLLSHQLEAPSNILIKSIHTNREMISIFINLVILNLFLLKLFCQKTYLVILTDIHLWINAILIIITLTLFQKNTKENDKKNWQYTILLSQTVLLLVYLITFQSFCFCLNFFLIILRPVETGEAGGLQPPPLQIFAKFCFSQIEKNRVKVKNSTKL